MIEGRQNGLFLIAPAIKKGLRKLLSQKRAMGLSCHNLAYRAFKAMSVSLLAAWSEPQLTEVK
jgi:hypothetical protein